MTDVFVFVAALVLGAAWAPWAGARRYLPEPGRDPDAAQVRYEAGRSRRATLRLLPPLLLAWFVGRALTAPAGLRPPGGFLGATFGAVCAAFVLSAFAATVWRHQWDRAFVARHPAFAGSVQPLGLRLLGPGVVLVAFSFLGLSVASKDDLAVFGSLAAAFVVLFGGQRLALAAVVRSRVEIPPDSPLGRTVAETVARFGFTPKRAILVPSTVANAFALPDGTVMVTTALRALATDGEIAGVIAHELSHVRDRDVPRMRRGALGVWLLMMLVAGGAALGTLFLSGGEAFVLPVVALSVATFLSVAAFLRTPRLHRLESKCDRAAAEIGLGPELARCLTKLHAYMGLPRRWVGPDRRLVTHPSLDDRLAALGTAPPLLSGDER